MSCFLLRIRNAIHHLSTNNKLVITTLTHFNFIHNSSISQTIGKNDSSLTISYLINSCGLSPQAALSASKKINIKTTKKPDLAINTLKSYDFKDTHITKLITKYPQLLLSKMAGNIMPKLDFYLTLGYSRDDLATLISTNPGLLRSSLEKRIKPKVELLRSILYSDQQLVDTIRRSYWLLPNKNQVSFLSNIKTLKSSGVTGVNIAKLVTLNPRALLQANDKFAKIVECVEEFGFNPLSTQFVKAVFVMSGLTPLSWERKADVFKSLGWSEEDVLSTFRKNPMCMALSEHKIRSGVSFYAKEMHWDPSFLAARPWLLSFSLEKRVVPRCSVMRILVSKGLAKNYPSMDYQFLLISKLNFWKNYITNFKDQAPEVLELFKDSLKPSQKVEPVSRKG